MMALERECFADPWPRSAFERELESAAPSLIATIDDRLVGFLCRMGGPKGMHVTNIAVQLEFRRKGIASRLLSNFLALMASEDCEWVYLDVRPSNSPALRLYEKYGFKEIFRRRKYYTDPSEDGLVLALNVSGSSAALEEGSHPSIDPGRTHS